MLLRWFLKTLSRLPFWVLYRFADLLFFVTFYVLKYRKKVIDTNLKNAFPEKTQEERNTIRKNYYKNLCDVIVEILKSLTISEKQLKKRVRVKDLDILGDPLKNGSSVLIMSAHQANWEWIFLGSCLYLPDFPMAAVYKPLSNPSMDKLMLDMRSTFKGDLIPMRTTARYIVRNKGKVTAFGLIADQKPMFSEKKHWVTFLNQDTAFLTGTQNLALLTKFPVVFAGIRRIKRGYYELSFEKIAEPPYEKGSFEVIECFAACTEKHILENPSDWLWSHRRWKYKRPTEDVTN